MRSQNVLPRGLKNLALACVGSGLALSSVHADILTYDDVANTGWFTADAWDGPDTWEAGDSAVFDVGFGTGGVQFDGSTTIDNLTFTAFNDKLRLLSASAQTLTFSGGTIDLGTLSFLRIADDVSLQGNYTLEGSGLIRYESATVAAYAGTATLNGGTLDWSGDNQLGTSSNFIVNGGYLNYRLNGSDSIGSVTLNSGTFDLGRNNSSTNNSTLTVTSLSGTGGDIIGIARRGNPSLTLLRTLNVNQTGSTSFAGNIAGANVGEGARIALNKQGAGDLTLSGTVTLARETTLTGGGLFINGVSNDFSNDQAVNGAAISVSGGTLGGTGTINVTNADNVVLSATGSLTAGLEGVAGRTTYNFAGGVLDLSAVTAGAEVGWLRFDLGSDGTAGTTFDQLSLTSGTLNIGAGLSFADFDFTTLGGFGPGSYVLFQTPTSIVGSLGTTTGFVGGFESTLGISGNNLVLTVVPEPQVTACLFAGFAVLLVLQNRRQKSRA